MNFWEVTILLKILQGIAERTNINDVFDRCTPHTETHQTPRLDVF
jgi:hypothetical protein